MLTIAESSTTAPITMQVRLIADQTIGSSFHLIFGLRIDGGTGEA